MVVTSSISGPRERSADPGRHLGEVVDQLGDDVGGDGRGRVQGDRDVPGVHGMLGEAGRSRPAASSSRPKAATWKLASRRGVEALEAAHQAFVGGDALAGLGLAARRASHRSQIGSMVVAPWRLATGEAGVEEQLEELGLAAQVGEHLGHRPLAGVGGAGQLVRSQSTTRAATVV